MFPTFSNLTNVVERADGSVVAQCPACAALGRDSKGHHLVVYENGAFGCIAFHGQSEEARAHRREVARLAGWKAPQRAKGSERKGAGAPPPVALVPWRSKLGAEGRTTDAADGSACGSPRPPGSSSFPFLTSRKTNKKPSETSAERNDQDTQPQPEIL
jgi:uncharacterized C2H2 Zn-finger protein